MHHRIRRDVREDYPRVATSLERCADVAAIQWGGGIWGGEDGESVLDFMRALKLPAVATLHTLPVDPSPREREILVELVESARAAVVMSQAAAEVLRSGYGIDRDLVEVIPYGVPDLPIMPAATIKPSVGLDGRDVILSFGLLAPGKGYELLIDALPAIVKARPKATYVIVGATHPDVRLRDGEQYRISLTSRAAKLGMADHVRFVPEFVGRVELARWLQAADVLVTPTPDLGTLVSGPLSHAMAAGRAIVSTPYPYAVELLADGRGLVLPPTATAQLPAALADAVTRLLTDEPARLAMGALAHESRRDAAWTKVGTAYQELFARVASGGPIAVRGRKMVGSVRG